jgi:hypothetical protein
MISAPETQGIEPSSNFILKSMASFRLKKVMPSSMRPKRPSGGYFPLLSHKAFEIRAVIGQEGRRGA